MLIAGRTVRDQAGAMALPPPLGGGPWELSFSYGRALQQSVLKAWRGNADNVSAAQKAYLHRAKLNSAARSGSYSASME